MKKIERIAALEQRVAALEAALGAKSDVAGDEPKRKAKPKLAVGQVWKMRNGETTEIVEMFKGGKFPWWVSGDRSYTDNGTYYYTGGSEYDLVELISDAPVQAQKSEGQVNAGTHIVLPKPYTTPPARGCRYWAPNVLDGCVEESFWGTDYQDNELLEQGLTFKTEEDAEVVLNAILSFLKSNTKDSD